jgi:hypothetical protein
VHDLSQRNCDFAKCPIYGAPGEKIEAQLQGVGDHGDQEYGDGVQRNDVDEFARFEERAAPIEFAAFVRQRPPR